MTDHEIRERLYAARDKLHKLLWKEESVKVQIAKTLREIHALAVLSNDDEDDWNLPDPGIDVGGLTDGVRMTLRGAGKKGITATDIRTELAFFGFTPDKYKNILASIHTVLGRLIEFGEIKRSEDKSRFIWVNRVPITARGHKLMKFREKNQKIEEYRNRP